MIIRFRNACTIFFLSLSSVLTTDCEPRSFSLSMEDKADYEQAVSRCISDSNSHRMSVNGDSRTELDISICQLEHYLEALYDSADGALQSSDIFKALDQNKNGQLSLCDVIFGAEEMKKDFDILESMFSEQDLEKKETKTDILTLVKVVDDQCDVSCQVCPESLCIRKDECAYNVNLGCFQTHQPTLTPSGLVRSEVDPEDALEVNVIRTNLTWNSPVNYKNNPVFTATPSRLTELLMVTSIIIWILVVVYLIRNRKCKCNLCSYRAPCAIERNMDQGLLGLDEPERFGELSEDCETSGWESQVSYDRGCIEGDNVNASTSIGGSTSMFHRSFSTNNSEIVIGLPIYDKVEPASSVKRSVRNPSAVSKQSFEKINNQSKLEYSSTSHGVMPNPVGNAKPPKTENLEPMPFLSPGKCPPVVVMGDLEDDLRKDQKTSSSPCEAFQAKSSVSVPAMETMHRMLGVTSSEEDSGYLS